MIKLWKASELPFDALRLTDGWPLTPATRIESIRLPFYADGHLTQITDPGWMARHVFLHDTGWQGIRLDGSSHPLHQFNEKDPPRITQDTVISYLKLFAGNLVLRDELLIFVDAEESITQLRDLIEPPTVAEFHGHFQIRIFGVIAQNLFMLVFNVAPDGEVTMLGDRKLAEDIPLTPPKPLYNLLPRAGGTMH